MTLALLKDALYSARPIIKARIASDPHYNREAERTLELVERALEELEQALETEGEGEG